jgi:hypothetical protein
MDASQASALVSSSVLAGQSWNLPGPGGMTVVVKSTDDRTAGGGPTGPVDNLVGLEISVDYSPSACNHLA